MSGEAIELAMEGCSRVADAAEAALASARDGGEKTWAAGGGSGGFGIAALASFHAPTPGVRHDMSK